MNQTVSAPELNLNNRIPYAPTYADSYFGSDDPEAEGQHVFLNGNHLPQRWQNAHYFTIGELGYGSGLNFLITADCWLKMHGKCQHLTYIGFERSPLSSDQQSHILQLAPNCDPTLKNTIINNNPPPLAGYHRLEFCEGRIRLLLIYGEALPTLANISAKMDAWYLDGFSPATNPDLWTDEIFEEVARLSAPQATLATYSVAGHVRRGLNKVGFNVQKQAGFGRKRHMLCAEFMGKATNPIASKTPWFPRQKISKTASNVTIIGNGIAAIMLHRALANRGIETQRITMNSDNAECASTVPIGILAPKLQLGLTAPTAINHEIYWDSLRFYHMTDAPITNAPALIKTKSAEHRDKLITQLNWPEGMIEAKEKGLYVSNAPLFNGLEILEHFNTQNSFLLHGKINFIVKEGNEWVGYTDDGKALFKSPNVVIAAGAGSPTLWKQETIKFKLANGFFNYVTQPTIHEPHSLVGDGITTAALKGKIGMIKGEDIWLKQRNSLEPYWQATRLLTPDRLPLVGAIANEAFYQKAYDDLHHGRQYKTYPTGELLNGLYYFTALGARGFQGASLWADILASEFTGTAFPVTANNLNALHPARFLIRYLKRNV